MKPFTKWGIVGLAAVTILAALPAMAGEGPTARPDQNQQLRVVDAYGKLPMSFEANRGQADPGVRFLARGSGYGLFLLDSKAAIALRGLKGRRGALLRLDFPGCRRVSPEAHDPLPGLVNYFIGNDPAHWRTGIPTFGRILYPELYPGVDLLCYGNQSQLEFDFVVKPGADPALIRLAYQGARSLSLSSEGNLLIAMPGGNLLQRNPTIYQEINGQRCFLHGSYVLMGRSTVGVRLEAYDRTRPLVIDPVVAYSTYLGGSGADVANAVAVDANGMVYVTGATASSNFPGTAGSTIQSTYSGAANDAFVAKFDPTQNGSGSLIYSTYLGGNGDDQAFGIAVDSTGAAYVTGGTNSSTFPVVHPAQLYHAGYDVFITELNPAGSAIVYSSYLGGSKDDGAYGVAVDKSNNVYIAGNTASSDFPVVYPIQGAYQGGNWDAFVTKLNWNATTTTLSIVYSTYLGGDGDDRALALAVDSSGAVYVTGSTTSPVSSVAFPTLNAFQGSRKGTQDAFLAKITFSGSSLSLAYSTYLGGAGGGTGSQAGYGLAVDGSGSAYVVGTTTASDFPTAAPFQASLRGGSDAFVTKFGPSGSTLVYSTYLGGSSTDQANAVAVDSAGEAFVAGLTNSADFPLANPLGSLPGSGDAFITKFNAAGSLMAYSTLLAGTSPDAANGVAVDASGAAYVAGQTASTPFPPNGVSKVVPYSNTYGGGSADAFVTKLTTPSGICSLACAASAPAAGVAGFPVSFTSTVTQANCTGVTYDWNWGDGTPDGTMASGTHVYMVPGSYTWTFTATATGSTGSTCTQSGSIVIGTCTLSCSATVPLTAATGATVPFSATSTPSGGCGSGAVAYSWAFGDGGTATGLTASHMYTSPGSFVWTLTASISGITCNQSGTITVTGTACSITCSADASPASGVAPLPVTFTANATGTSGCGTVLNYDWNFGDGSAHGTTVTANHLYVNPGTYTWVLTVSVGTISCTKTGTVSVVGPLTCSASAAPTSGMAPLLVNFTSSVSGGFPPYTYSWDLGDGTTSAQPSLSHTYSQLTGGTYRAVFTVTDSQGQTCSDSHLVITVAPQCVLTCSASSQATGTAGTPVAFAGSATLSNCPGSILYAWAFGDGTTSSAQYPTHVYSTAGTYTWTMTASAAGLKCTRSGTVAVGIQPVTLAWMKEMENPFRIVVHGTNLQYGVQVYINGAQWGNLVWKNTYKLILKGGDSLQTVVPMNVPTQFRFVNPDGSELTVIWQWP